MRTTALLLLVACGTTRDGGCTSNNTTTAERYLQKVESTPYTCITDGDDGEYLCSPSTGVDKPNYRCADSAAATDKVKCIRWFPTE